MTDGDWERVLWKRQPFPDNYRPISFLSSLRKNANFRPYTYGSLLLGTFPITQHLSTIFIFITTFIHLLDETYDARILIWLSILVFLAGYIFHELLECYLAKERTIRDRADGFKSAVIVFLALLALSPLLRTLTAATSSDSIWALSACLFIINVLLSDYRPSRKPIGVTQEHLVSILSSNAAISSSVVLASRLPDDVAVFALVLFSVQLFSLFPIIRTKLHILPAILHALVTIILVATSIYLFSSVSHIVTAIICITFLFITFGGPALLMWAQKHKREIRGPWDVAVPIVR